MTSFSYHVTLNLKKCYNLLPTRAVFSKSKLSRTGSLKASLTFVGGITIVRLVANRNTINLCQKGFTCRIWTADIS